MTVKGESYEFLGSSVLTFNATHNTADELMLAVKELSPNQLQTLALDLVWKMSLTPNGKRLAKRAILEATRRPYSIVTGKTK